MAEMVLPDEMTAAMRDALGIPNFRTGPIAHLFRADGQPIPKKMEEEQAVVLFWALRLAIEHGDRWREVGDEHLREMVDRVRPKPDSVVEDGGHV
jgi:hypothetical protein